MQVQRRTKAAAESSGPLTAGPLASPLEPPSPSKPAAKKEDTSPVGVPQVAVGVISLALAVVLVVTSVGGGGDPVTTADVSIQPLSTGFDSLIVWFHNVIVCGQVC